MDQLGERSREKLERVDKGYLPPILLLTPGGTEGEIGFAGGGDDVEVPLRLRNDPFSYNVVGVIAFEVVEHHGHNISSKTGITLLARRPPVVPGQMAVLPDFVVCLGEGVSAEVAEGGRLMLLLLSLCQWLHALASMSLIPLTNSLHFPFQRIQKLDKAIPAHEESIHGLNAFHIWIGHHKVSSSNGKMILKCGSLSLLQNRLDVRINDMGGGQTFSPLREAKLLLLRHCDHLQFILMAEQQVISQFLLGASEFVMIE